MIDKFLRTETEAQMLDALTAAGLTGEDEDGNTIVAPPRHTSVHVIGVMQEPTGETTTDPETGEELPVHAPIPGWHVNVRTREQSVADALAGVTLDPEPDTPHAVFAG